MTCDFHLFAGKDAPVLQPVWNVMRERQDLLLSPFWTTSAAFITHLFFSTIFMILDLLSPHIAWIHKHRIAGEAVGLRQWLYCLAQISTKYVLCVLPLSAFVLVTRGNRFTNEDSAPSLFLAFSECFACLLVFDALFFMIHYATHRFSWVYRMFHHTHHQQWEPFALAAQDSSIMEMMVQQGLAVYSAALLDCHPLSELLFHLVNVWLAVEDHCGYDFSWATHRLLPCFGGAPFHQAHHRHFNGNYAPYFRHWDMIFGTALHTCKDTSVPAHAAIRDK